MQSCSVHHCVLFLLTLTFTTDPASAAVYPIYTKLHQPVTLPCESSCDGVAMWNLISNRDVVFAECNKTSCRSLKDGYEMSHTRYKEGDLSLTITNPDYSMRETYACECGASDYATVRLRISTVLSTVQMSPGENLKMDLSVPEPVEVIYKSRDSAAGEQICTVTKSSLQCKAEYTPRTSLSYPELTLRGVTPSERGTYIIRETESKEEIRVYAVSVPAVLSGVHVSPGEDLKLDLSAPDPVEVIYKSRDSAAGEQICTVTNSSLQCKAEYTPRTSLSYPELTLRGLWRSEGGTYTIRNLDYKEEIRVYAVSVSGLTTAEAVMIVIGVLLLLLAGLILGVMMYKKKLAADQKRREVMKQKEEVDKLFKEDESKPPGEEKKKLQQQMKEMIEALWQQYRDDSDYKDDIALFCIAKRYELVKRLMREVDDLIQQSVSKPPGEKKEKLLQQVEEKIDVLEEKYRDDSEHKYHIRDFCKTKRIELKRIVQGDLLDFRGKLMTRTEVVVSILQELESQVSEGPITDQERSEMCKHAESHLQRIRLWCSEQDTMIKKFRDQPSGDVTNAEKIHNKETHVNEVEKRDKEKNDVLERSRENIKPAGETDPLINVGLSAVAFVKSPKHSFDATFSPDSGIEMAQYQPDLNVVDVI